MLRACAERWKISLISAIRFCDHVPGIVPIVHIARCALAATALRRPYSPRSSATPSHSCTPCSRRRARPISRPESNEAVRDYRSVVALRSSGGAASLRSLRGAAAGAVRGEANTRQKNGARKKERRAKKMSRALCARLHKRAAAAGMGVGADGEEGH